MQKDEIMSDKFIVEGTPEWEQICEQCGMCCLMKYCDNLGNIYLTRVRCAALDKKTRKCACYAADLANRDKNGFNCSALDGACVTRFTLNNDYTVPSFCPYAQKFCTNPVVKKAKKRPNIDWENTVSETEIGPESLRDYIIPGSNKYFKYNPQINQKMHEIMKKMNVR